MKSLTRALGCALLVGVALASSVAIGQDVYVGTITRMDEPQQVIIFDDGRMYRVLPNTVLLVERTADGLHVAAAGHAGPGARRRGRRVSRWAVHARRPGDDHHDDGDHGHHAGPLASAEGVVASYDPETNLVTLTDGRVVQLTSKTAILIAGHPSTPDALWPGTSSC